MRSLPLTVPYHQGETPTSFASRLGRRNGVRNLWNFCHDTQISVRGLIGGETAALQRLGSLGGIDWHSFIPNTLIRQGQFYALNGQRISRKYLRRERLFACPHCFESDIRSSTLRPAEAAFYRTSWQIGWIRTCVVHAQTLVALPAPKKGQQADTATVIHSCLDDFDAWKHESSSTTSRDLEAYLSSRIAGNVDDVPFLRDLNFDVAARTCGMIGALSLNQRTKKQLTPDQLAHAREVGFKIAAGGGHSIRSFLHERLERALRDGSTGARGLMIYQPLYSWLARGARDHTLDPVRVLVRDQIIRSLPLGPGENILGEVVGKRVIHSVRSASLEIGAHPVRVRKLLEAHGFLQEYQGHLSDDNALFDADAARELLHLIKTSLPACRAGSYLGTTPVQTNLLVRAGLLRPFSRRGEGFNGNLIPTAEMDRFLSALLKDAVPTDASDPTFVDIATASHRSTRSVAAIVTLVIERRLVNVRRNVAKHGFASVLVDPKEVRQELCKSGTNGLAAYRVARELHINVTTIDALIATGALSTVPERNPITRQWTKLVPREQVSEFEASFVTLTALARQHRTHAGTIKRILSQDGVQPAFDEHRIGATIYKRDALPNITLPG